MKAIASALVKAQKEFGPALKTKLNGGFKSQYADLQSCVDAVLDALNNNGIFLMQVNHEATDGITVETIFVHESGETLSAGKLHVPAIKFDPQGYGSALTYARRYSLMAACGIAPEDDDGEAARKAAEASKKAAEAAKTVSPVIAKLNDAARKGTEVLRKAWRELSEAERKSVPEEKWKQIKEAASIVDANVAVQA